LSLQGDSALVGGRLRAGGATAEPTNPGPDSGLRVSLRRVAHISSHWSRRYHTSPSVQDLRSVPLRSLIEKSPDQELGAQRPYIQPIRAPRTRSLLPTSIGTSTATDDHGHPRNRRLRRRTLSGPSVTFASRGGIVVSSLVSSAYVRLRSLVFGLMQRCRSRTLTVFGELLSKLLKIGRSAIQPGSWPPPWPA
jgi:hypothetical protein